MSGFNKLLAQAPDTFIKDAAIESPDEKQLENDFANMAFAFLQDRAANLLPFLLGFEVVEREDDGSKAIGIFGFKVGEDYYYVPAFFTNGQVRGMDLLFSKRTNSFVPLREPWINYVLNRQAITLGDTAENAQSLRRDFEQPDFDFVADPPNVKRGGADAPGKRDGTGPATGSAQKSVNPKGKRQAAGESCPGDTTAAEVAWVENHPKRVDKELAKQKKEETDEAEAFDRRFSFKKKSGDLDGVDIAVDGFNVWNDLQHAMVEAMDKDAEFQQAFACAIARVKGEPLPIEKSAENSAIGGYLYQYGGVEERNALMMKLAETPSFANAFLTFYPTLTCIMPEKFAASLAPAEKAAADLQVITESRSGLGESDKKRLLRDGFTVIDRRGPGKKSEVFETDYIKTYANPDRSGTYNVLLRNGSLVKAWVCEATHGINGLVVVHPQNNCYFTAESGAVIVEGDPDLSGKTPYDAATAVNRMRPGTTYILVNEDGKSSAPFAVRNVISENRRRTQIEVSWKDYVDHKARKGGRGDDCCTDCDSIQFLQLADHKGPLSQTGKHLVVPANWKALEVKGAYDYSEGEEVPAYDTPAYTAYSERRDKWRAVAEAFKPGDQIDLDELLEKRGIHDLVIENENQDSEFHFTVDSFVEGPFGYKTAAIRLVKDYGIDAALADELLQKTASGAKVRRLVKFAQGVGGQIPAPAPQPTGYDSYSGVPIEYADVQELQGQSVGMPDVVNGLEANRGINMGGQSEMEASVDPQAMDLAQQAANAGQKHVFDHATIGGLSRLYDTSAVIDSYIPELSKSLDRIGRILFIFYWKNEEFGERYGDEDMGEMEDLLRGVFKSFGDMVLKLKQKSVDTDSSGTLAG